MSKKENQNTSREQQVTGTLKIEKSERPGFARITKVIEIPVAGDDNPLTWFGESPEDDLKNFNERFGQILSNELLDLGLNVEVTPTGDSSKLLFQTHDPIPFQGNFETANDLTQLIENLRFAKDQLGVGPNPVYKSILNPPSTYPSNYWAIQESQNQKKKAEGGGDKAVPDLEVHCSVPYKHAVGTIGVHNPLKGAGSHTLSLLNQTYGKLEELMNSTQKIKRKIVRTPDTKVLNIDNIYNQPTGEKFKPEMPEYLVFAGGGIKGVAHLGVLKYLVEEGFDGNHDVEDYELMKRLEERRSTKLKDLGVKGVAGTSAGSLISLIVALNLSYNEIMEIVNSGDLKWSKILVKHDQVKLLLERIKESYYFDVWSEIKLAKIVLNFLKSKFADSGENLQKFVDKIINQFCAKRGIQSRRFTFKELYETTGIAMTAVVTEVESLKPRYLNHINSPNLDVAKAIRTSMNIPLVFEPVRLDLFTKEPKFDLTYVDGGLCDNFPIDYYDAYNPKEDPKGLQRNYKTLGSYFYGDQTPIEIKPTEKLGRDQVGKDFTEGSLLSQIAHLFAVTYKNSSTVSMHKEIRDQRKTAFHRAISINIEDVQTIDIPRGDSKAFRERLIQMGWNGAENFLKKREYQR